MKVGDTVRIKSTSRFYKQPSYTNPRDINGNIIRMNNSHLGIVVIWSNRYSNCYNAVDLEIVDSINNNYSIY